MPTPPERAKMIETAKLLQVRQLIGVMRQNNPVALTEILYRLTNSFKGRLITDAKDEATPEEMAQSLLVAVLMSAITVQEPEMPPAGQYAVIDVEDHHVIRSFATKDEAEAYLESMGSAPGVLEIVPVDITATAADVDKAIDGTAD